MTRMLVAVGVTLLFTSAASAQAYCEQVRQAVATYGYAAAKRHALATYGAEAVAAADKCVRGKQSSRKRRTESALVENIDMAQRVIDELRQSGIRIALDDFGTGYATLAQLQTLNLDKIKIDRRFVDRVVKDRESLVIVRAILGLASGFGLTTTAEGIEEDEQRACLQANGCLEGQGYLFSEAVPASSILALLKPAPLASTTA